MGGPWHGVKSETLWLVLAILPPASVSRWCVSQTIPLLCSVLPHLHTYTFPTHAFSKHYLAAPLLFCGMLLSFMPVNAHFSVACMLALATPLQHCLAYLPTYYLPPALPMVLNSSLYMYMPVRAYSIPGKMCGTCSFSFTVRLLLLPAIFFHGHFLAHSFWRRDLMIL